MPEAIHTALSALRANLRKLDVTANNVANAGTHDFKTCRAVLEEAAPAGVKVTLTRAETPGAPLPPDETLGEGHAISNVCLEEELVGLIPTRHAFAAGVRTIRAEDEMQGTLLDILA